jgi:hypothetical protein
MLSLALATILLILSTALFLQKFKRPKNFPPGKLTLCCRIPLQYETLMQNNISKTSSYLTGNSLGLRFKNEPVKNKTCIRGELGLSIGCNTTYPP